MKFLFILTLVITCGGAVMRFVNAIPQKPAKGDIANLLVATAEFFLLSTCSGMWGRFNPPPHGA